MKREIIEKTKELRKKLHEIPEPSMHETKTKKLLMDFISENTSLKVTDCESWFYITKYAQEEGQSPKKRRAIAFRADMDAVCGKDGKPGHYCGHDGHSAILAGLALWLDERETDKDIYLIFQPAEETGEGAAICCKLLEKKNIKEVYGLHNIPGFPMKSVLVRSGTFACASTGLAITMTGTPSHAGYPEAGKNPGYALARLLLAVQELTAKIKKEKGFVLMTLIGMEVGSANYGVSASNGTLRMTVRGEKESVFNEYLAQIRRLAEKEASEEGLTLQIEEIERFPATENHDECVDKVRQTAERAGASVIELAEAMRWSEDFGCYLQKTPGAFFGIGDGEAHAQLHTVNYEFPDEIIETALKMFSEIILEKN